MEIKNELRGPRAAAREDYRRKRLVRRGVAPDPGLGRRRFSVAMPPHLLPAAGEGRAVSAVTLELANESG